MESQHFSSGAYALLYLRASMLEPSVVLAETGYSLTEIEALEYIPVIKLAQIFRNCDAAGLAPGWAARVGEQLSISSHGPLGFAALSAPTMRAALQVMMDYHAVRVTSIKTEILERDGYLLFTISDLTGDAQFAQWLAETVLRVMESLVETIMGHPVGDQLRVSFTEPAPSYRASLAETYGSPCQFNAAYNAISIPSSWGDIRSPLYDEDVYRANISKCREIIRNQEGVSDPVSRVKDLLRDHFDQVTVRSSPGSPPALDQIAESLHVTPRTLIRYLRKSDTSFRQLLEQARVECAQELLAYASLTVADVGRLLGYSDPANFGRAFKRWQGTTPAAWRRLL
jgi:AraC-like DNA-binding protein